MNSLTKLAHALNADLARYNSLQTELTKMLDRMPDMDTMGREMQRIGGQSEAIKNRYLGMPPKPALPMSRPEWGMVRGDGWQQAYRGIDPVDAARYRVPNMAGLPPTVGQLGPVAHQSWLHNIATRSPSLMASQLGRQPMLEQALTMSGLTGPSQTMGAQVTSGGSGLGAFLKSWRRKMMTLNPEFRQAFRYAGGYARPGSPGAAQLALQAARAIGTRRL